VRVPEYCVEEGVDTARGLRGRYRRWGRSDAEYFVRLPPTTVLWQRIKSFTRAFWVEVFPPLKHATVLNYALAFPVLLVFGIWRFGGFLSAHKSMRRGPARLSE
jgi:hypothetical protein